MMYIYIYDVYIYILYRSKPGALFYPLTDSTFSRGCLPNFSRVALLIYQLFSGRFSPCHGFPPVAGRLGEVLKIKGYYY